ncbi:MAG TPA: lipopolysaccharide biosynthesis protein [Candidatus Acidoferrum sp.]|nr:lipopolysaccharide biosynthesis protein [Candidatus Acidoferrum sp.]
MLRDALGYFGSKVVPGFLGLISVPVFIRLLGAEEYGRFAVILPLLMAIGGASSGWLAQGILRFHPSPAEDAARRARFNAAVFAGTAASVAVTAVVLVLVIAGLHYQIVSALIALAFGLSLVIYSITLARLQAQLRPMAVLTREIVRSVAAFALSLLLVLATGQKRFDLVLLGQALGYTIALAPMRGVRTSLKHTFGEFGSVQSRAEPVGHTLNQLWRFGWAVGIWLLLSQTLPVVDRWVIQRFTGYAKAGVYASLYEVAIRSFSFLIFPLTQAAHPRIMRSWNQGEHALAYRIIKNSIKYQLVIFVAVFVVVLAFADRIVRLILGFDDQSAARMLPLLILGGFLWQLALLIHKPLEIKQQTSTMLAGMAMTVVIDFFGNYFLIPRFGYRSAAYMVVFSACTYITFTLCVTRFRVLRASSPRASDCPTLC